MASQESIKILGTNGGGFFNVNSSMPFENPSGLTNFLQMLMILSIPAGLTATFGRMVGNRRQGWAIYARCSRCSWSPWRWSTSPRRSGSPAQDAAGLAGGNLEGKEVRFGQATSALYTVITTVASCGAVTSALDSLTGIGGLVPLFNMGTGEVIFGGVGSGLYGMLLFVLLAVFIAGLMVGRTPEYLGKKIEAREVKLVMIGTLAVPLHGAVRHGAGGRHEVRRPVDLQPRARRASRRPSTPTPPRPTTTAPRSPASPATCSQTPRQRRRVRHHLRGPGRWRGDAVGRFVPLVLALAVAGALAGKKVAPVSAGTFRTDSPTFVVLLISVIVIVAALTLFPAFLLGPIVQGLTDQLF